MKISLEAKRLKDLEPQIRKAVSIAHNRTMKKISSDIGKEWGQTVLDELSFSKAPNIREFVKIRRERKRNLNSSAIITIDSKSTDLTISPKKRSISIRHFQHRQTSQGVVLKIKNQPKLLRSAFITKMPNKKHAGIYQRVNKARLPIKEIRWTTGIEMVGLDKINAIQKSVTVSYSKTFKNELKKLF